MHVPSNVRAICEKLHNHGHEAWVVGGAVRDSIMGRPAHDWDISTSAHPRTLIEERVFSRIVETGIQHGTVTVMLNGEGYEVTTYRGDGEYTDGRRPDKVTFLNTIEEDLARRDFTVNAIAYSPLSDTFCDPFGGRADIEAKVLRAVGDPSKRFAEDGLRVLRAARFVATLGFTIEAQTFAAIRPSLGTYANVSVERIQEEWFKAMTAEKPSKAFRLSCKKLVCWN